MPLVQATLQAQLEPIFRAPPFAEPTIRSKWGAAIETYTTPIVPPLVPGLGASCRAVFEAALVGMSTSRRFCEGGLLASALTAWAGTYVTGLMATTLYASVTPPPSPFQCPPALGVDPASAAAIWAAQIHAWYVTGTWVPISGTGGGPWT